MAKQSNNVSAGKWNDDEPTKQQLLTIAHLFKMLNKLGYDIPEWRYMFDSDADGHLTVVEQMTKGEASEMICILKGFRQAIYSGLDLLESITKIPIEK